MHRAHYSLGVRTGPAINEVTDNFLLAGTNLLLHLILYVFTRISLILPQSRFP